MAKDEEYQGYTNRETWALALWLDNEEPLYRESQELAKRVIDEGGTLFDAEDALEGWVREMRHDACEPGKTRAVCSMFQEIGSLWRVNFREVLEGRFESDDLPDILKEDVKRREAKFEQIKALKPPK